MGVIIFGIGLIGLAIAFTAIFECIQTNNGINNNNNIVVDLKNHSVWRR